MPPMRAKTDGAGGRRPSRARKIFDFWISGPSPAFGTPANIEPMSQADSNVEATATITPRPESTKPRWRRRAARQTLVPRARPMPPMSDAMPNTTTREMTACDILLLP